MKKLIVALCLVISSVTFAKEPPILTGQILSAGETEYYLHTVLRFTRYESLPLIKRPKIVIVPEAEFVRLLCSGPCTLLGVRFWARPDVVYVRDRADFFPGTIRAIIVHELTHWVQAQNDLGDPVRSCGQIAARELEAYAAGYLYDYLIEKRQYNLPVPDTYDACMFESQVQPVSR